MASSVEATLRLCKRKFSKVGKLTRKQVKDVDFVLCRTISPFFEVISLMKTGRHNGNNLGVMQRVIQRRDEETETVLASLRNTAGMESCDKLKALELLVSLFHSFLARDTVQLDVLYNATNRAELPYIYSTPRRAFSSFDEIALRAGRICNLAQL